MMLKMYLCALFVVWASFFDAALGGETNVVAHGAQIRVTNSGLRYLASLEARLMEQKITQFAIPEFRGSQGPISFWARNTHISYLKVGRTSISIIPNVGLQFNVPVTAADAFTTVSITYHAGWVKVGDTTTVTVKPRGVDYSIGLRMTAVNGHPHVEATSCRANIRGLDVHFSGGLAWLYNLLKGILIPRLKGVFQDQMCRVSKVLVNNQGNQALAMFPTKLPILNLAYIDYSFQQALFQGQFMDWLLLGEFVDFNRPVHSRLRPPVFNTASLSSNMAYIWLTDYSLNTLGEVVHNGKLVQKVIHPSEILPPFVKQFLNTATLKDLIPILYKKYPDRPMEIGLETFDKPVFKIFSGSGEVNVYARANMKVVEKDGKTKTKVFHVDISCDTHGEASLKIVENQLRICGKITSKNCTLVIGGSTIGDFKCPVGKKQMDEMIQGLVINQVNPILARGIPLPQSPHLVLRNPSLTLINNAMRVGTDFEIRL